MRIRIEYFIVTWLINNSNVISWFNDVCYYIIILKIFFSCWNNWDSLKETTFKELCLRIVFAVKYWWTNKHCLLNIVIEKCYGFIIWDRNIVNWQVQVISKLISYGLYIATWGKFRFVFRYNFFKAAPFYIYIFYLLQRARAVFPLLKKKNLLWKVCLTAYFPFGVIISLKISLTTMKFSMLVSYAGLFWKKNYMSHVYFFFLSGKAKIGMHYHLLFL